MRPIDCACSTCGSPIGTPCRQVGPGGGQAGPPPAEKLGIVMVTFHAARKRAAKKGAAA